MSLFISAIIALAALSSTSLAAPLLPRQAPPGGQCINGKIRTYQPQLHNIYYYSGASPSVTNTIKIFNGTTNAPAQDQVAVWSDLPSDVTGCRIGYSQAVQRSFAVYDNGLVRFSQMSGLPDGDINSTSIQPLISSTATGGAMDFTFWPETVGAADHVGGLIDCGTQVAIYLYKDMVNGGKGDVTMEQDAQNGFWLEHSC